MLWSKKTEGMLEEYKNTAIIKKWLHEKEYVLLNTINTVLNTVSIGLSGLSAVFANISLFIGQFTDDKTILILNLFNVIMLYLLTIINLSQHILDLNSREQTHYSYSNKYNIIYNNINRVLVLESGERQDFSVFYTAVTKELDNLTNNSPRISSYTVTKYEKVFSTKYSRETNKMVMNEIKEDSKRLNYELERYANHNFNII